MSGERTAIFMEDDEIIQTLVMFAVNENVLGFQNVYTQCYKDATPIEMSRVYNFIRETA